MLDLAQNYNEGPVQIGEIAKRQDISVKYLEQLIIPLKKANFIKSLRGPKGGHMLAKSPEKITIGQIVEVLEGGIDLTSCVGDTDVCEKSAECLIRDTWKEATKAMYEKLNSISLAKIIKSRKHCSPSDRLT